ncbi:DUF294 nucleotidyltransferase-like domain-containing protein, partial [Geminicoccus flavidas]|uniref:DUF294 nucleotidyltransferase-like domain-containing protein n=1 Tax=Geminicoccus flavidas TaxID=2506407 RepID=UPI002AB29C50
MELDASTGAPVEGHGNAARLTPGSGQDPQRAALAPSTTVAEAPTLPDAPAIRAQVQALGAAGATDIPGLTAALKRIHGDARGLVRAAFEAGGPAEAAVEALSSITDGLIQGLLDLASTHVYPTPNPTKGEGMAVLAVGGYGRSELCPHSDIDLLFLVPYKRTPVGEQITEYLLYRLWDLGLKVGQATRTTGECIKLAQQDLTVS